MIGVLIGLLMINGLCLTGAGIWVLVLAAREGAIHVVLCLLIPFYFLYYVISRFDDLKPAGTMYLSCVGLHVLLLGGVLGMAAVNKAAATTVATTPGDSGEDVSPAPQPADSQPDPMPAPTPDSSQPAPEPTPDSNTPTPESTTPTPEGEPTTPTPVTVPEPIVPAVPPEPKFPPGLQGDAQRAFHEGRIEDGKNYLRAALLSSDDKSLWNNVRWYPGLGRPAIGLRWGIALQMAETPPMLPRGDGASQPNPTPQGEGPPAGLGENPLAASDELSELRKFTGDFGPKLMEALPKSTLNRLLGPLGEGVQAPQGPQFVGLGTDLGQVQSMARQQGVDMLLVAVIVFKVYNRGMDAQLTLRLIDVATEKRLWTSKQLNSNQVKAAINKGQNPFGETINSLTDYLEHHFQPLDKPDLDNVKIRQRADAVAREETASPLPALVELRYYQLQGLITPLQAETSYQRIVEIENASLLADGSAEERRRVIERFLPRAR